MEWGKIASEVIGVVLAGVFGPPIIALVLRFNQKARKDWLSRPWVVSALTTTWVATVVSIIIWFLLAHSLSSSPPEVVADIGATKAGLINLQERLLRWSADPAVPGTEVGSGDPKPPTMCPTGYYAAGINWWGAPDTTHYCIGCLSGIQIICRKLNAK